MAFEKALSATKAIFRLYQNAYKSKPNQPDITGNVLIPYDLINIMSEDEESQVTIGNTKFLKMRVALWTADDVDAATEAKEPIISGSGTKFEKSNKEFTPKKTNEVIALKRKLS